MAQLHDPVEIMGRREPFSMSRNCSIWCRSLLLSFSKCYLGMFNLGLEGAINCILAQTSHQRTTSEKRTKALLPKCPLFGGSTVLWNGMDPEMQLKGMVLSLHMRQTPGNTLPQLHQANPPSSLAENLHNQHTSSSSSRSLPPS